LASGSTEQVELCVLGAREEADAVPIAVWLELCVLTTASRVNLSMIGPEAEGDERSLDAGPLRITQARPSRTSFSESPLGRSLLAGTRPTLPDAFVLFNPGLHAGKYAWRPSMEAVLATGVPLLLTAYSDQDAASDARWLADLGGAATTPVYVENPWASLEPWSSSGDARANRYMTILHGHGPAAEFLAAASSGKRLAPQAPTVPSEQAWMRRSAMRDFFEEGPRILRQQIADWWR
jgi:hypothetical protein